MWKANEVIRSRQNRAVSELVRRTDRRVREETRTFRFDGVKLAKEALSAGVELPAVFLKESSAETILRELEDARKTAVWDMIGKVYTLSDDLFDRISEEKSPEGVICCAKYLDKLQKIVTIYNVKDDPALARERIVLLESVRDPVNLGAIIRCAAALGVDRLILSTDCADIYHPRTVRASMGTLFRQKIDRTDRLPEAIGQLREQGRRVFAATLDGRARKLGGFEPLPGDCVVIGNEGHGLSEEVCRAATDSVFIPMEERAESLNAAVAAGILMWEFGKSR